MISFQITSLSSLTTLAQNMGLVNFSKLLEVVKEKEKEFSALFLQILTQDLQVEFGN